MRSPTATSGSRFVGARAGSALASPRAPRYRAPWSPSATERLEFP